MAKQQQQKLSKIISECKSLKSQLPFKNSEIQNYLQYQQSKLYDEKSSMFSFVKCCSKNIKMKKGFRIAYERMTKYEKASFYLMNLKCISIILNQHKNIESVISSKSSINHEQFNALVKEKKNKRWCQSKLIVYSKQNIIKADSLQQEINLQKCLIRKSKGTEKQVLIFVLENTPKLTQIRIKCPSRNVSDSQNMNQKIAKWWEQAQETKLRKLLMEQTSIRKRQSQIELESQGQLQGESQKMEQLNGKRDMLKLSEILHKQIYFLKKQMTQNDVFLGKSPNIDFYTQKEGTYYRKDQSTVRKTILFSNEISQEMLMAIIGDSHHTRKRKPKMKYLKVLKSFPTEEAAIYHSIERHEDELVQFCYFRHYFRDSNRLFYIEKSLAIDQIGLPYKKSSQNNVIGLIQYCIWMVTPRSEGLQLSIEAKIFYPSKVNNPQKITDQFIGQFADYISTKCMSYQIMDFDSFETEDFENEYVSQFQSDSQDEFVTVTGSLGSSIFQHSKSIFSQKRQSSIYKMQSVLSIQGGQFPNNSQKILKHKYPQIPAQKGQPSYYHQQKGHKIMGEDWVFDKQGGIVNVNVQKIKMQSSVLKLVFQKIGRNILTGKSILNVSLPVEIFYVESNLEILAKSYRYSPRFLEPASVNSDPVERLKNILCLKIGIIFTQIIMEKPFNPILGETYQGMVDGCPIYGEQISHHPPISSLYMVGRGYKIFGNFEAKVHLGINSASGGNQGYQHLKFDDYPGQILFNSPSAQIHGLLYGDRKVICTNKSYIIDEFNRLFIEIKWGKNKNGITGFKEYHDCFTGQLVKIKPGVDMQKPEKIKTSNYQTELGFFYGRLSGSVYYQGQKLYTIQQDYGNNASQYSPCLESDCRNRPDIIMRKSEDYIRAQEQKEILEQIQRRDRKLRAQFKK